MIYSKSAKLIETNKMTINQLLQNGNTALVEGRVEEAELLYNSILKSNPQNPDANHNLGLIKLSKNQLKLALLLFKNAIETNPNFEQFWLSYVEALITDRQFENTEGAITEGLKKGLTFEKSKLLKQKLFQVKNTDISTYSPQHTETTKLLSLYQNRQYIEAEDFASLLCKQFPNHPFSWKILGAIFGQTGRDAQALKANKRAVLLAPKDHTAHNNLGNTLRGIGKLEDAELSYRNAIQIKPNFAEAHNNLGTALAEAGKTEEAEVSYRKATKIKPDFAESYFNLGVMLFEANKLEEALIQFNLTDFGKSKSYLLRCLYLLDKKSLFLDQLDYSINKGEVNAMIGSLGCRSSLKYGIEKENLFCKDPLKYVLNVNLKNKYDFEKIFIDTSMKILNEDKLPYRPQSLLTNGRQTSGNLFNIEDNYTKEIQKIIRTEVDNYKNFFKDSKEGLIKYWPTDYIISGWLISMKSGSNIRPHIHECGWLSGSVYVNIPPKININSGNLVVAIEDDEYLGKEIKNQKNIINVVTGSLALFPASLLHHTIPFQSEEERIVLAFDVIPK